MSLFMVTRKGNCVQGEVHTMLIAATTPEHAKQFALDWEGLKQGFEPDKIEVKEVPFDKEQIILIQSL